jgi:hypothetical protein
LLAALRRKFKTREAALQALGLDADLLNEDAALAATNIDPSNSNLLRAGCGNLAEHQDPDDEQIRRHRHHER